MFLSIPSWIERVYIEENETTTASIAEGLVVKKGPLAACSEAKQTSRRRWL